MGDPTSVGEENETFFIRVWKPLPSRCVLKTLRGSLKGKAHKGQYLLAVGELGLLQMVLEPDTGRCTREQAESQRGWTRGGVPARMLAPEGSGLEGPTSIGERMSVSEDAGL